MLTKTDIIKLRKHMLLNEQFPAAYEEAIEWGKNFKRTGKERFSLTDHFRMLFTKNKWARTEGYAFLNILREDYKLMELSTIEMQKELDNLEARILGQCLPDKIIRFHGDSAAAEELTDYVRSEQWFNETFFKSV